MPLPSQLYLWDQRTLYIGPLSEPLQLSQGAATLVVSLDHPVAFKTPEMEQAFECNSLLLPPGMNITIDTQGGTIANCNLDPMGADWAALTEQMKNNEGVIGYTLKAESFFQEKYLSSYQGQMQTDDAYNVLNELIEYAKQRQKIPHKIDQRILSVVDTIKSNVDNNISIESLAEGINLSVPRLIQLFKIQTGIPVRRYRLWHRLFVTAINIGKGLSLTDAAVAAGFSDSAHFTNTFRAMLGMTPTSIILQPNSLRFNLPKSQ